MPFYKKSTPDGLCSGYDHADTVADALAAYKRCRVNRHFILTDNSPDLKRYKCNVCKRRMDDYGEASEGYRGNICQYFPKRKIFILQHYLCSWKNLLNSIFTSYTVEEAGIKLRKTEKDGYKV